MPALYICRWRCMQGIATLANDFFPPAKSRIRSMNHKRIKSHDILRNGTSCRRKKLKIASSISSKSFWKWDFKPILWYPFSQLHVLAIRKGSFPPRSKGCLCQQIEVTLMPSACKYLGFFHPLKEWKSKTPFQWQAVIVFQTLLKMMEFLISHKINLRGQENFNCYSFFSKLKECKWLCI